MSEITVELYAEIYQEGDNFRVENLWFAEDGDQFNLVISIANARGLLQVYLNFPGATKPYLTMIANSPQLKQKIHYQLGNAIEEMLENE